MEYYRRQPLVTTPATGAEAASSVVENVARTLRQLLPMPSSAGQLLPEPMSIPVADLVNQLPGMMAPAGSPPGASIVSEAAAILDEEMARGVLGARAARQAGDSQVADPGTMVLRQLHEIIDNIARLWSAQGIPASGSSAAAGMRDDRGAESVPHLKPSSRLRRGQRGTVSMTLCNKEDRPVQLTPMVTDLINTTGGRLPCGVFEFVPKVVRLDPAAQMDVVGQVVIPADCTAGCYAGLVVVNGVDYLRALITIDVE